MKKITHRSVFLTVCLLMMPFPGSSFAQTQAPKASNPGRKLPQIEAVVAPAGVRYVSNNRRDPFLNPLLLLKKVEDLNEEVPRGTPPPGIAGMYIAQVILKGVVTGEGLSTAVFAGTDKRAYFLQEKDKLFDGYIKKIEADSVILIRETKLRSGKVVTQEVTKRLRTP